MVIANICHIYPVSRNGPRGKSGLTTAELNSPDNLVLFCRNHHAIVDGQYETYPATRLRDWKQSHESRVEAQLSASSQDPQPNLFHHQYFPTGLVDQRIEDEIARLRKARFYGEFDRVGTSKSIGRRIADGELSGGTDKIRSKALGWCARILAVSRELDVAIELLNLARGFASVRELEIARAFIASTRGDKRGALSILARVNTRAARSAALMVVTHHDGHASGVSWVRQGAGGVDRLDADGKWFFVDKLLEMGRWDEALHTIATLNIQDFESGPVLHHMVAITRLIGTVPTEYRALVRRQLPFRAAIFLLAEGSADIRARRVAHHHFVKAAGVAHELGLPRAAGICEDYALWIELRDPERSAAGRQRLEEKLRDTESALRLVPLGLEFGIRFDISAVKQEIERQVALNGGLTPSCAVARLYLAFDARTPEDTANYLEHNIDDLSEHLEETALRTLQIELLSRANLPRRANECLKVLIEGGSLSTVEESRLRTVIAEAEGVDPIGARLSQFKRSDALDDLQALVDELGTRGDWPVLCEYGSVLFERTGSISAAESLAAAMINTSKSGELLEFLSVHEDLLSRSRTLQIHHAAALYAEGALCKARTALAGLGDDSLTPNYRALQVRIGISMGDWDSLSVFVANEFESKDGRSARDLIGAAQLAFQLGGPYAKQLAFAAADKGHDDPEVLAAAYFLASRAGWETEHEVPQWIQRAAEISGEDGPIRRMRLKDLLDSKPHWEERVVATWNMVIRGELPMYDAARLLNKSLVELMLVPALVNQSESNPSRRSVIPAYSGARESVRLDVEGATVGMDATALITLSYLNILDTALDSFDTVYIPHGTLTWLFEEKQRVAHHQASRIKEAHELSSLLSMGVLEMLVPVSHADGVLADEVGGDLALLIAEAQASRDDDDVQRLVVRSSPVHRRSSLIEEEADLSAYSAVMTSCVSVVEKLRDRGQITGEEERRSRAYLQLHERRWPNEPAILDGAVLYLDDLTVQYFLHLGLLARLGGAGLQPMLLRSTVSEADSLLRYEGISKSVNDAIERMRLELHLRIVSGGVKVGRQQSVNQLQRKWMSQHPTLGVMMLADTCDALVSDDRCLNQHRSIDDSCAQLSILSTSDLLDALVCSGALSEGSVAEHRTLLRRSGYVFLPIKDEEIASSLQASAVKDGVLFETAELKAIRENIVQIRTTEWLQLPKEDVWLNSTLMVFINVLRDLWRERIDDSIVTARADWVLNQIEIRGWAHRLERSAADYLVQEGRRSVILLLLAGPNDTEHKLRDAYWHWVERRILAPVKEQFPIMYKSIVEEYKKRIERIAESSFDKETPT